MDILNEQILRAKELMGILNEQEEDENDEVVLWDEKKLYLYNLNSPEMAAFRDEQLKSKDLEGYKVMPGAPVNHKFSGPNTFLAPGKYIMTYHDYVRKLKYLDGTDTGWAFIVDYDTCGQATCHELEDVINFTEEMLGTNPPEPYISILYKEPK